MASLLPEISQYTEYRKYLRDAYTACKARDRRFSHRFISQKMGIPSSGWFADILAGRQNVKSRDLTPLSALFKLEGKEREFLRVLVGMEQSDTSEERTAAYEKWLELKGIQKEKIAKDQFKYFQRWYYPILREILALEPFQGDYAALASKVHPPITATQAREAVQSLARLGLLAPVSRTGVPILIKDTSTQPQHSHKLQQAYMRLAPAALRQFNKEQRDFSAITLSLSRESLKRAGEEIALLRSKLLMLSEKNPDNDRVYQCLFQVFPVSDEIPHA